MRTEEELAQFIHAQHARDMERDEGISIKPFEDYRDQWIEEAREILRFLNGETIEL